MKVLYATMQYGRGYGQGTERYLSILGDGLRQRGHEAIVLAGDPERRGPPLPPGATVESDPLVLACPSFGRMAVVGGRPEELAGLISRHRPDVVHVTNPAHIGVGVIFAARSLQIPVVVTVMDYWWLCPKHTLRHYQRATCDGRVSWRECARCTTAEHPRPWLRALARTPVLGDVVLPPALLLGSALKGTPIGELRRWPRRRTILAEALNSASAVIFPSKTGRRLLEPVLRGPRACSIPYGLEPRWFDAGRRRKSSLNDDELGSVDPAGMTIGYAGALAEHKGVHVLLEAVAGLGWTRTRVRIAGAGADARYAKRLHASAAGLKVEFVGQVASEQMPAFLSELDLLVVPSLWPENLPIAVLEAQAVGVPVLASRVDGIAEMLPRDEDLFERGSAASLGQRLKRWCSNPHAPNDAKVTTADAMVEDTLKVYEQITAGSRPCDD